MCFILKPPYKEGKRGKIKNGRDSISSSMILANKKKKEQGKKKKVNKIKRELNKELKVCLKTTKVFRVCLALHWEGDKEF